MHIKCPAWLRHRAMVPAVTAALACGAAAVITLTTMPELARASGLSAVMDICTSRDPGEAGFAAENDAAMNKMMAAMAVKPSGDIDRDFAAMMIPHHQGAIEMAQAELRHGSNEQLRRIAQEIIVEQQQEIAAMHLALDQPLPPSAPAPTQAPRR